MCVPGMNCCHFNNKVNASNVYMYCVHWLVVVVLAWYNVIVCGGVLTAWLEHKEQVRVLFSSATVEVAIVGGAWDVVCHQPHPHQAAQHYTSPTLVTEQAPAACREPRRARCDCYFKTTS